jgi:hypothetical protein
MTNKETDLNAVPDELARVIADVTVQLNNTQQPPNLHRGIVVPILAGRPLFDDPPPATAVRYHKVTFERADDRPRYTFKSIEYAQ